MDRLIAANSVVSPGDVAPLTGTKQFATSGDPALGIPATVWPAYQYNAIQEEIIAVIVAGGLTPDNTNNGQVAAAIAAIAGAGSQTQSGNYVADTGSGSNIYVATLSPALLAPVVGMPIRIRIAHSNSGPSTLNVNGLGAVAIHDSLGNALAANALRAGMIAEFYYDGAAYQLAVPAFAGNITANGNFVLPGGLWLQWGTVSFSPSGGAAFFNVAFSFLTPFPSACFVCLATGQNKFDASSPTTSGAQDIVIIPASTLTASGATARVDNNASNAMSGSHSFQYFAIGH